MVKIRYVGNGVALSSRTVIEQAITNTSLKFDNNIIANRFEESTFTTWEVTIKCVSSRGKGAKRGATGRRTQSCCWHVWGTFFDELFKLNARIVIVAQGNRITRESGNWIDRLNGAQHESEMCDCEENGWVRESPTETFAERIVASVTGTVLETPTVEHNCDASCRHSRSNNNGTPCTRICGGVGNPGWEPFVPTVERHCSNCRYSRNNNETHGLCTRGRCLLIDGLPLWELYVPISERRCDASCAHNSINTGFTCPTDIECGDLMEGWTSVVTPPQPHHMCNSTCAYNSAHHEGHLCDMRNTCLSRDNYPQWTQFVEPAITRSNDPTPNGDRRCSDCRYSRNRTNTSCAQSQGCLVGNEHRFYERWVEPAPTVKRHCTNCKYSYRNVGAGNPSCSNVVGRCLNMEKWELFTERLCNTCKYSEANNNGVMCYTVVGRCGMGNPKWELFTGVEKTCSNCKYSPDFGCKSCYAIIGICNHKNKWKLYEPEAELNAERYLPQPQVMPEEKKYMDIFGGE